MIVAPHLQFLGSSNRRFTLTSVTLICEKHVFSQIWLLQIGFYIEVSQQGVTDVDFVPTQQACEFYSVTREDIKTLERNVEVSLQDNDGATYCLTNFDGLEKLKDQVLKIFWSSKSD